MVRVRSTAQTAAELGYSPGPLTQSSGWAPGPVGKGWVPRLTVQRMRTQALHGLPSHERHLVPEVRVTRLFHGPLATPVPWSGGVSQLPSGQVPPHTILQGA